MIIRIFLLSVFISFFSCVIYSQAEHPPAYNEYIKINENAKKILQSKIKKCTEIITVSGNIDTLSVSFYDNTGSLTKFMKEATDTTRKDYKNYFITYVYLYDKEGHLLERVDSTYPSDVRRMVLYYDDNGSISKEEEYMGKSKLIVEKNHDYDMLSRLIESDEIYYAMNCKANIKYAYDSYNSLAKVVAKDLCKDPDGRVRETKYNCKYDKANNIIEKQSMYPNGATTTETFKYDAKGNVLSGYEITNKSDYTEFTNTYDKSFNKTKVDKTEVVGEIKTKYSEELKYDNTGNLIESKLLGPNGDVMSVRKFIYETY